MRMPYLKVPGGSLVWNALLTKKLPTVVYFCGILMKLMDIAKRFYQYRDHFEVT